ncbi:MAG TPA: hypothetical protein DCZ94_20515 [Lentisphaeria bacterium]|nr:MAG: hypothetical protein A2X48_16360 [Lentisphaerae bacterium GWF2_49_21]HBC89332.1 hypothetical protein [Lentisphaeria bacterium]
MKKMIFICACLVALFTFVVYAKVKFSNPPPELTHDGVTYKAVRTDDGVIHAIDAKTGKLLWQTRLYKVQIDQDLEPDVQWIYIQSITESNGQIIVVNGNGTTFSLDPKIKSFIVIEPTRKPK